MLHRAIDQDGSHSLRRLRRIAQPWGHRRAGDQDGDPGPWAEHGMRSPREAEARLARMSGA
jgi:hypothetical protein